MKRKAKVAKPAKRPRKPSAKGEAAHIGLVLDMSGSMDRCRQATISGFNEWLGDMQRRGDAESVRFSMLIFSSTERKRPYQADPVALAKPLDMETYTPSGCTPLYDAIGEFISELDKVVGPKPKKSPLIVVMTDGEENASAEFCREKIFDLIRTREKAGWTFAYLGANQDAWATGASIGVPVGNTMPYVSDPHGTKLAFAHVSRGSGVYAQGGYQQTNCLFGGPRTSHMTQDETNEHDLANQSQTYNTLQEAAKNLKVSPSTIRRQIRAGNLPAKRIGKQIRIQQSDLEEFLKKSSGVQ